MSWKEKFDNFRKSRRNSAYQMMVFPNGEVLYGRWNIKKQWEDFGLPESLKRKSVLDVGSNLGGFCIEAVERGAKRVEGFEPNATTFAGASEVKDLWFEKAPPIFYKNFKFEDPYIKGKFDIVFAFSILQHIKFPKTMLKKIYKILNSGGKLYCEILLGKHDHNFTEFYKEPVRVWKPTKESFITVVESLGFKVGVDRKGKCEGRITFELLKKKASRSREPETLDNVGSEDSRSREPETNETVGTVEDRSREPKVINKGKPIMIPTVRAVSKRSIVKPTKEVSNVKKISKKASKKTAKKVAKKVPMEASKKAARKVLKKISKKVSKKIFKK